MRKLAIAALLLLIPTAAVALDCTPFQTWTCSQQGYNNYMNLSGVPGEVLCGTDYTGWTFHVVNVTTTQPGLFLFSGVSASASWAIVGTKIFRMDDCSAGTCLDSSPVTVGVAELYNCVDVGTHTFVVASNTTASTAIINIGINCLTCAEVEQYGLTCQFCDAVSVEEVPWGSVKSQFK